MSITRGMGMQKVAKLFTSIRNNNGQKKIIKTMLSEKSKISEDSSMLPL